MNEYVMGGARELALFNGAMGVYPHPVEHDSTYKSIQASCRSLRFLTSVIEEALWRLFSCSLLVAQALMGRIQ
jgi:hypothetical protein